MTPSLLASTSFPGPGAGVFAGASRPGANLGWGRPAGSLPGVASARLVGGLAAQVPVRDHGVAGCGAASTVGGGRDGGEPFYVEGCGCGGTCSASHSPTPYPPPVPPVPPTKIEPPPSGGGGQPGDTDAPCTINCDNYSCDSGDIAEVEAHCKGQGLCAVLCEYSPTDHCTCALTTSCDTCPDTTPPAPEESRWL